MIQLTIRCWPLVCGQWQAWAGLLLKFFGEFIPGSRVSKGSHRNCSHPHLSLGESLLSHPVTPVWAGSSATSSGSNNILMIHIPLPSSLLIHSKLSYPFSSFIVILVQAGSSWLLVNLNRRRL